jgi:hypothetical protein
MPRKRAAGARGLGEDERGEPLRRAVTLQARENTIGESFCFLRLGTDTGDFETGGGGGGESLIERSVRRPAQRPHHAAWPDSTARLPVRHWKRRLVAGTEGRGADWRGVISPCRLLSSRPLLLLRSSSRPPCSLTLSGGAQYYSDSGYAIIYTPEHPEGVVVADPMADCLPGVPTGSPAAAQHAPDSG